MEKNSQGIEKRPRVGVGVLVLNDNSEVLIGLRKSSHGSGEWGFPGGHLEFGESIYETAQREVKEETGLDIDEFELISVADVRHYIESDGKHYLNTSVMGKYQGGEPQVLEPHKCDGWKWFSIDELPDGMFVSDAIAVRNFKDKKIYQPEKDTPRT